MRVELALILGIVVFCCWCAYIVAQMNASVAPSTASSANQVDQQQQYQVRQHQNGAQHNSWASVVGEPPPPRLQAQATQASGDHVPSSSSSSNANELQPFISPAATEPHDDHQPLRSLMYGANNSLLAGHHFAPNHNYNYNAHHQFARLQEASAPPVALVPGGHQLASSHQFADQQQLLGQQQQLSRQPLNYDPSATLWPATYNALPVSAAGHQGDASAEPSDEQLANEDEDEQRQSQADQERDQQATAGNDQQEEPDDEQAPKTELEETSKRRSFDENEYDSSERDRQGNLIKSRRRHLLNGRPVGDNTATAPGPERVPTSLTKDADEFERLVDEIDSERAANNKNTEAVGDEGNSRDAEEEEPADGSAATPTADELAGDASARPPSNVVAAERRRDAPQRSQQQPNKTRVAASPPGATEVQPVGESRKQVESKTRSGKPKDLHEHRMHETLSAQQWDDDSSLARPAGSGDDDEQEAEEESRRLEEMSDDLLFNGGDRATDEPPRLGRGARSTRRRRNTQDADSWTTSGSNSSASSPASNQTHRSQPDVSHVVRYDDENEEHASRQKVARPALLGESPASGGDSQSVRLSNTSAIGQRQDNGGNIFIQTHSRPSLGAQRARDAITGQEDISVEVLADPPAPRPPPLLSFYSPRYVGASSGHTLTNLSLGHGQHQHHHQQQPSVFANYGPNYQLQTIGASVPTQPVVSPPVPYQHQAMSQVNQLGASFPQIESPFASGSAKKVTKKKNKKKVSKGVNSKYKAAKAYEAKLKSKQKKGNMYKKKKKSHKNLKAGKKHFAGSIRGKKAASGSGHKGADKGANFFKDKGYKKRGFKKVYHKLETGDHKTYFDEFRDKDHNKKWKKFDDKHKYSKKKKWSGDDMRHVHHQKSDEAKGKASKDGQWKEKASSKHTKKSQKLKKSKKAEDSEGFEKKKKKKAEKED